MSASTGRSAPDEMSIPYAGNDATCTSIRTISPLSNAGSPAVHGSATKPDGVTATSRGDGVGPILFPECDNVRSMAGGGSDAIACITGTAGAEGGTAASRPSPKIVCHIDTAARISAIDAAAATKERQA